MGLELVPSLLMNPVKYKESGLRGFIVHPHNDDGSDWGEPLEDESGKKIVPGTVNGPNPNAFLFVKDGAWGAARRRAMQCVGNIDWKGPWKDEKKEKRWVVTVNGPTQRYWNDGSFTYGANETHYIYCEGRVTAVAPYPVLGAALHTDEDGDVWVVAMCISGGMDTVYVRKARSYLLESEIDNEVFIAQKSMYSAENPTGWRSLGFSLGYVDAAPSVAPETPWFFNEDGNGCRTMRRCPYTHSELSSDSITEDLYREITCTINVKTLSALFTTPDNLEAIEGFTFKSWLRKDMVGAVECSQFGIWTRGTFKAAVDYDPERKEWVYGWIEGQLKHVHSEFGASPSPGINYLTFPEGLEVDEENFGYIPMIGEYFGLGYDDYVKLHITSNPTSFEEGRVVFVLSSSDAYDWYYLIDPRDHEGEGYPETAKGSVFVVIYIINSCLQYMDLRSGLACGYSRKDLFQWTGGFGFGSTFIYDWKMSGRETQWGMVGKDNFEPPPELALAGKADEDAAETDAVMMVGPLDNIREFRSLCFFRFSYSNAEFPVGSNFFYERKSYDLNLSTDNDDGSLTGGINWFDVFPREGGSGNMNLSGDLLPGVPNLGRQSNPEGWFIKPISYVLRGDFTKIKGVIGTTELGESLAALEFTDVNYNEEVSRLHTWNVSGEPLDVLKGGNRLTKGGLV